MYLINDEITKVNLLSYELLKGYNTRHDNLLKIGISWDESGIVLENEIRLFTFVQYEQELFYLKNLNNSNKIKYLFPNGVISKDKLCIDATYNNEDGDLLFFLEIKDKQFNDLEFLTISIVQKEYICEYRKKLDEIQSGSIFYIGNFYNSKFIPVFENFKNYKFIQKGLKIKIDRPKNIFNGDL